MKIWIIALSTIASILTAQATVIYSTDFTDAGFYSTGVLNGQNNWGTDGGGGVETIAGTGAVLSGFESSANSASTAASISTAGETFTSAVTFSFDDVSTGGNNAPIIGASIFSGSNPTNSAINGLLQKSQGSYRIQLRSNWGSQNTSIGFAQSGTFSPESIGITIGTDQNSDVLTLSLALIAGTDANSWDANVTLFNETTASQVFQWTPTSDNLGFSNIGTALYGGFMAGQSDANSKVGNRIVTSSIFESTIPEPATLGLLSAGTLLLFFSRKLRV